MCGQFLVSEEIVDSLRHLVPREHWEEIELDLHPHVIYPSARTIAVCARDQALNLSVMTFGFASSSMNRRIFNARLETASSKPLFARAWRSNRVAVPATAFYEWTPDKEKITFDEPGRVLYLAALALDDQFIILTQDANESVVPYHHRMPVILQENQVPAWVLDSAQSAILAQNASPALHAILPEEPLTLF